MAVLGAAWLAGCAAPQSQTMVLDKPGNLPQRAYVTAMPSNPDLTALSGMDDMGTGVVMAIALRSTGQSITPAMISAQLKRGGGQPGNLQSGLVAAVRHYGRLAYPVHGIEGVLREVAAGRPVVVLQDVGPVSIEPKWRYAVVNGYDLSSGEVMLASSDGVRKTMPLRQFERSWAAAGRWGLVALKPGDMPANADRTDYLLAVAGLARDGSPWEAAIAYDSALSLWPDSPEAFIGLGNSLAALGDRKGAAECFEAASKLTAEPGAGLSGTATVADLSVHDKTSAGPTMSRGL